MFYFFGCGAKKERKVFYNRVLTDHLLPTGKEAEGRVDPQAGEEPQQGATRGRGRGGAHRAAAAPQGVHRQVLLPRPAAAAAAYTRITQYVTLFPPGFFITVILVLVAV